MNLKSNKNKKSNPIIKFIDYLKEMGEGPFVLLAWLCIFYGLVVARFIMHRFGMDEGIIRETIQIVIACIPVILFFIFRKKFPKKNYVPFFILLAGVIILIIVTVIFNPAVRPFLFRTGYGLDRVLRPDAAIYAFLFFSLVDKPEHTLSTLRIYSYLESLYLLVIEFMPAFIRGYWEEIGPNGETLQLSYSLTIGYAVLFPTVVFMYFAFRENRKADFFMAVLGVYMIFTQGNRGALVLSVGYMILMLISDIKEIKNIEDIKAVLGKKLVKFILFMCTLLVLMFAVKGVKMLTTSGTDVSAEKVEEDNRNLQMFKDGSFTDDNGRKAIWEASYAGIKEHHFLGGGFFADRPYVAPVHAVGHSHNLIVEFMADFGILGLVMCIILALVSIRMVFFTKERDWRELFMIMFCTSCQLLISRSFWYIFNFWATLAIVYKYYSIHGSLIVNKIIEHKNERSKRG